MARPLMRTRRPRRNGPNPRLRPRRSRLQRLPRSLRPKLPLNHHPSPHPRQQAPPASLRRRPLPSLRLAQAPLNQPLQRRSRRPAQGLVSPRQRWVTKRRKPLLPLQVKIASPKSLRLKLRPRLLPKKLLLWPPRLDNAYTRMHHDPSPRPALSHPPSSLTLSAVSQVYDVARAQPSLLLFLFPSLLPFCSWFLFCLCLQLSSSLISSLCAATRSTAVVSLSSLPSSQARVLALNCYTSSLMGMGRPGGRDAVQSLFSLVA
ncbi:uncharacterized protein B0H18DRAFT_1014901 [Fomitopsis serialis]|uniref:uncharacterized protein n=1 Tax=Fomitopsis serialis TaxID=139415 RepID=UPI0020088C5B|nr:uncharacterized protein B0H18DRAFT_1014901 [Neoantrodia serialis]KAH9923517.1 hypothetical protein B0H18DRAFT_1014901 [Neoantrodia serialis]